MMGSMDTLLKEHKARQDSERYYAGSAWNAENLVFCSQVGTIIEPRRVATTMGKLLEKAGLPHISFHALRHPYVKPPLNFFCKYSVNEKPGTRLHEAGSTRFTVYSEGLAACSSLRCREWAIPALILCEWISL